MKSFMLLFIQFSTVVLVIRWLYSGFVMPARLSKYSWCTDYLSLCDYIEMVESYEELEFALDAFYKFSGSKEYKNNPDYKYAVTKVAKLLRGKYFAYRNKSVVA